MGIKPKPSSFIPLSELSVSVPGDGSWRRFWVVGWRASNAAKDIRIVAREGVQIVGEVSVMVRVRKDAEALSSTEIRKLLSAVAKVHDKDNGGLNSQWVKHARAHSEAFNLGIHGTPLFGPWHRAFLLALERELQAIDRTVALPYWRFDRPAPKLFTREFIGVVGTVTAPGGFVVDFDTSNPLKDWQMFDGRGPLVRRRNASQDIAIPAAVWASVMAHTEYADFNDDLEAWYHNDAHNHILGWLGTGSSPRDPLFYLLHANVDRAWAHWQARHGRFDPEGNDAKSYSATGSYPGSNVAGRWRKGVYAKDTMWPWNQMPGNQGTPDPRDDWPTFSYPLPASWAALGPTLPATPRGQVDYLDTAGNSLAHGVCYDDMNFVGKNPVVDHQ
jgi:tyrosinase